MEAIEVNRSAGASEVNRVPEGRFDLSFWREDLKAGATLAPIIIAFGIGIASISLFPLQSGLVSAVVAVVAAAFLGGSYLVLCGAAAALAPILANLVLTLGQGDMMLGYERTLAVIVITGPIMCFIGWKRKAQHLATLCAHAVMAGVLAAIAFMLLVGRIEAFTGIKLETKGHGLLKLREFVFDGKWQGVVWPVLLTTVATIGALILLSFLRNRSRIIKSCPPQLWAILLLLLLGLVAPLASQYRINIPVDFWSFHRWPDFDVLAMWKDEVFFAFVKGVVTLGFVDPLETVATLLIIDRYDKYRRKSDVNSTVAAMGVANIISGYAGGMSNIPGGAQSSLSERVGTVTPWASLFAVVGVVLIVWLGRDILNLFSVAGLSAVIIFTVYPLCEPAMWRSFFKVGIDQGFIFAATFIASILVWDILWGIIIGVLLQVVIVLVIAFRVIKFQTDRQSFTDLMKEVWRMICNPKSKMEVSVDGLTCDIYFTGLWVFFSPVEQLLEKIPATVKTMNFHLTSELVLMDQPTIEKLLHHLYGLKGQIQVERGLLSFLDCRDKSATRFAPYKAELKTAREVL